MPVFISHGQPKSGSTFLFQASIELRNVVDGGNFYTELKNALGDATAAFQDRIDRALIERLLETAGSKTLTIKTHGALADDVRAMIEDGRVRAFTSFRDPRDACRSMLDAGIADRAKGNTRWFASKTRVDELVRPIKKHLQDLHTWIACPKVLCMPYYIIANNQDFAVRTLCHHLGHGALGSLIAGVMGAMKTLVPEFHKGESDRFLSDFSPEEIAFLNRAMAPQIETYYETAARKMVELGHRMLHDNLVARREARLAGLGLSEAA
jgi:hypothetical protein